MKNYDEKMVLNSHLVIKIEINWIRKKFVKSMNVKKFRLQLLRTIHTGFEKVWEYVRFRLSMFTFNHKVALTKITLSR